MFKRSLLSIALVVSLASPVVQAETWSESARLFKNSGSRFADKTVEVGTAFAGATKVFAQAMFNQNTYKQVLEAAQNAYNKGGFKAAGQELVRDKRAVAGVALGLTALAAIGYAVHKTYFAKQADK